MNTPSHMDCLVRWYFQPGGALVSGRGGAPTVMMLWIACAWQRRMRAAQAEWQHALPEQAGGHHYACRHSWVYLVSICSPR